MNLVGNWDCGRAIPFLGIFVSSFQHWFFAVYEEKCGIRGERETGAAVYRLLPGSRRGFWQVRKTKLKQPMWPDGLGFCPLVWIIGCSDFDFFCCRLNLSQLCTRSYLWPTGWRHCLQFLLFLNLRGQWDLRAERCYQTTAVVLISPNHTLSRISDRQDDDIACCSFYSLICVGKRLVSWAILSYYCCCLNLYQPYTPSYWWPTGWRHCLLYLAIP